MVFWYTIPFTCLLFVLLLDFSSCTGLVFRDRIPQVIARFYLSPHSPPTFEVVLTRFGSLISPYVPLGHQSDSALWLQLCNMGILSVLQQVTLPSFCYIGVVLPPRQSATMYILDRSVALGSLAVRNRNTIKIEILVLFFEFTLTDSK